LEIGILKDCEIYSLLEKNEKEDSDFIEKLKKKTFILSKFKSKVSAIEKIELIPDSFFKSNSLLNNYMTSQLLGTIFHFNKNNFLFSCKIQMKRYFFKINNPVNSETDWFKIQLSTNHLEVRELLVPLVRK
jgi:hypothetical protein